MTSSIRKRLAATAAVGALAGAALIVSAPPAGASDPSDTIHYCGSFLDIKSDDGAITDFIHHNVEPLAGALQPQVHGINCVLLAGMLGL